MKEQEIRELNSNLNLILVEFRMIAFQLERIGDKLPNGDEK